MRVDKPGNDRPTTFSKDVAADLAALAETGGSAERPGAVFETEVARNDYIDGCVFAGEFESGACQGAHNQVK